MWSGIWLALALVAIPAAAVVCFRSVNRLTSMMRAALVAVLPLSTRQDLVLPAPGAYELWGEGGRMAGTFRGVDFQLTEPGGRVVPLSRVLVRTKVSGVRSVRVKLRTFSVERAGTYGLSISGLTPEPDERGRIRITRATGPEFFTHVLGIVGGGILLVAAVVVLMLVPGGVL